MVLSGTRGHGLARLLPNRAPPGPHEPLRAAVRPQPRDGPRERLKRGGCTAALRAAGNGRRFPRTSLKLAKAPAARHAAGTRTQRPEPNRDCPTGRNCGRPGSARWQHRGYLAAAAHLRERGKRAQMCQYGLGRKDSAACDRHGRVSRDWYVVRCMHVHRMCGMCIPKRTSLGPPPRAMERPAKAAAATPARPLTPDAEPWTLAATAASEWPPVRVGVGG